MQKSMEAFARELDVDKERAKASAGAESTSALTHLAMIDAVVRALTTLVPLLPAESILYKV